MSMLEVIAAVVLAVAVAVAIAAERRRAKWYREFEQHRAQRPPFRNPGEGYQPIDTGKRPARPPRGR